VERIGKIQVLGNNKMKITKQQLKRIIKEELLKEVHEPVGPGPSAGELMGKARENFPPDVLAQAGYGEEMSSESQALFEEGKAFFAKLIEMGKDDQLRPDVGAVLDALGEWVSEESHEYVKIKSGY
jgi:hypothetical protein